MVLISRPESTGVLLFVTADADHFAGTDRHAGPSGEPRLCEIERAPEELDRAAFAREPAAKFLEHPVGLYEDAPAPICGIAIIRTMRVIDIARDRILDLRRQGIDRYRYTQFSECIEEEPIELGNGHCSELDAFRSTIGQ